MSTEEKVQMLEKDIKEQKKLLECVTDEDVLEDIENMIEMLNQQINSLLYDEFEI